MQYITYLLAAACLVGTVCAKVQGAGEFTMLAWILATTGWVSAADSSWQLADVLENWRPTTKSSDPEYRLEFRSFDRMHLVSEEPDHTSQV